MKLLRFGDEGYERPGLLAEDGSIRDLSQHCEDIDGKSLAGGVLQRLHGIDTGALPIVDPSTRIGACIGNVGNFIAVGLNYSDHAKETNAAIPVEPILFNKANTSICGPNDAIRLLPNSVATDWEAEIAFVIGRPAFQVGEAEALSHVAGFCICHDVSERDFQIHRGGQWMKGKSAPTFGPLGPWLVTPDKIADVQALGVWLEVNGEMKQQGNTGNMIFPIAHLIHYITQFMRLMPGDVVTTGTPAGVGLGMKPPQFLKAGDTVRLGIDGLGEQRQTVMA